ncbi:DUF1254 domain-containing protein [Ancylobacter sp. IITR112]|uniref:DUF1254 domain-containing protein n=1 Tax=Ancylobacter sp. IITR112 TaxID=3138073 RepID=UPI00352B9AF6
MTAFRGLAAALTAAVLAIGAPAAASEGPDAATIARDAYIYLYPLVTMEVTRQQLINLPPSSGLGGPMNVFVNVPGFPTADMKTVVRPNFDTLYSSAWLDLSAGPLVVSAPDTQGRYYLLPMLDMWTDVFASPGWRTTGTAAADYLVTPPGWTGTVPAGLTRIAAPTPTIWIIGRTKTDGPADYAAVHKVQAGFRVTPLAAWGRAPEPPPVQKIDPAVDVKTPPKLQVDGMSGPAFFAKAAELLKLHPPHLTDEPILAQMKRLGLVPGASYDAAALSPAVKAAIDAAPASAQELMAWKVPKLADVVDGWSMNVDTMGVYGNYYLKRAIIAQQGLGANLPEDAIYPLNFVDAGGHPLDGTHRYTLRFPPGQQPPADAFWSVTLYDAAGYQVANPLERFALSSWMPLKTEPDGTLVLYVQADSPGADRESNWLPAPKGPFNLTMRLYAPRTEALTGRWNPPAVTRAGAVLPLGTP